MDNSESPNNTTFGSSVAEITFSSESEPTKTNRRTSKRTKRIPTRLSEFESPLAPPPTDSPVVEPMEDVESVEGLPGSNRRKRKLPSDSTGETQKTTKQAASRKKRREANESGQEVAKPADQAAKAPASSPMLDEVKKLVQDLQALQQELKGLQDSKNSTQSQSDGLATLKSDGEPESDDNGEANSKKNPPRRRKRAMTTQQKQRLNVRICTLKGQHLQGLLDLVAREAREALVPSQDSEDEVELDLSKLSSAKLWMLDDYCKRCT